MCLNHTRVIVHLRRGKDGILLDHLLVSMRRLCVQAPHWAHPLRLYV